MTESVFQFTNPALSKMEFLINEGFDNNITEVQMKMNISVNVSKSEDGNKALVSLICEIGEKSNEVPLWICAEENADFKWNDEISEDLEEKLLHQNAPSLLLSYLRPIVSQLTAATRYGAYNIPFVNFTK